MVLVNDKDKQNDSAFQNALDFGAKKLNEKQQSQMNNKNAKKLPAKQTPIENGSMWLTFAFLAVKWTIWKTEMNNLFCWQTIF